MDLLGHDTSFAHIIAINNCYQKNMPLKRVAYLASTLFLKSNSKSLILMIANL